MTEDICANCRHLLVPADQRSSIIYEQEPKYTCHVYQHTGANPGDSFECCGFKPKE